MEPKKTKQMDATPEDIARMERQMETLYQDYTLVEGTLGETMVVALAAGATGGGVRSIDPLAPGQTMTAAMAALATGSDNVVGTYAFQSLFFVGLLLFAMTLLLNVLGDAFVRRTRQRY